MPYSFEQVESFLRLQPRKVESCTYLFNKDVFTSDKCTKRILKTLAVFDVRIMRIGFPADEGRGKIFFSMRSADVVSALFSVGRAALGGAAGQVRLRRFSYG